VLGSEGIFGVITEAWMRVQARPRWRASASVKFTDFAAGVAATRDIAQAGLYPSNCRLLDRREAMLHRVTADGTNVLLLGFESADHPLEPWMDRALAIATAHGGACPDGPRHRDRDGAGAREGEAGTWREAFIDAPYLFNALVSLGLVVDTFETACTWERFDELHRAVVHEVRAAMKEHCGTGLLTCRFTHVYPDGPAPYYTFIAPGTAGAELEQHAAIKEAASGALIAHGATITHHHAVGRLHRPWYDRQRPEPLADVLRAAKRTLDPTAVLNPGVLIDPDPA
jgi:alkyldihydroxyacetonephosphate synthase